MYKPAIEEKKLEQKKIDIELGVIEKTGYNIFQAGKDKEKELILKKEKLDGELKELEPAINILE